MSTTKMLLHTHVQQTVAFINRFASVLTTTVKLLEMVKSMAITIN